MSRKTAILPTSLAALLLVAGCGKKDSDIPSVSEQFPAVQNPNAFDEPPLESLDDPSGAYEVGGKSSGKTAGDVFYPNKGEAQFSTTGRYVVQVSVFKSARGAERLMETLANQGYPAYTAQVENPTAELFGTYHRVRIGRFATVGAAREFGNTILEPLGYQFWVDNKANDEVGSAGGSDSYEYAAPVSTPTPTPSYTEPAYSEPAYSEPASTPTPAAPAPSTSTNWDDNSWDTPAESTPAPVSPIESQSPPATTPAPAATDDWSTPASPSALDDW